MSQPPEAPLPPGRWNVRTFLRLVVLMVALALGGRGLGDERYLSLQGDMPRHLMNGVFFYDALHDLPAPSDAFEYARHYYARYPALSLGHHPMLLSLTEVPSYLLFGISVFAGRIAALAFFVAATLYLFRLGEALYADPWAAAVTALAFATSPFLVELTQSVMTELPALALVVICTYYCFRFSMRGRSRDIRIAVALASAALWAKQLAVVMLPALVFYTWWYQGWRRLVRRDVLVAIAVGTAVVTPLVFITLRLSPFNVALAQGFAAGVAEPGRVARTIRTILLASKEHLAPGMQVAALIGLAIAVYRRTAAGALSGLWIATTLVFIAVVAVGAGLHRLAIYWVPGWAIAAGALVAPMAGRLRPLTSVIAVLALLNQVAAASQVQLPGADGYEAAARLVVERPRASTVLFVGDVDTGFFTFFVRKHDPERRTIVLRADKLLTTSFMGSVAAEDRVSTVDDIRAILRRYGVGYIVVEERPSESRVHNWLLDEVRQPGYVPRLRMPFQSTDVRLRNRDLVVYEVAGAPPAEPDARLDIHLPLVSQEIDVSVADLINRKYLR
ncbi:MAG: glycosyltransferase family 39 protein [Vicinamibacterales bacterium]